MVRGYVGFILKITAVLSVFLLLASVLPVLAEESSPIGEGAILRKLRGVAVPTESSASEILDSGAIRNNPVLIAGGIVRGALALIGLVFLILTVYGGSLYLTAGGNEETVKKAKNIIVRAMIGILIALFAGAITQFFTSQI